MVQSGNTSASRLGIDLARGKTLTIPKWLNDLAESRKVNFSQLLQSALKHYLGVETHEGADKTH